MIPHVVWFLGKANTGGGGVWIGRGGSAGSQQSLLFLHESSFVFPETYQMSERVSPNVLSMSSMEFLLCMLNAHTQKLSHFQMVQSICIWQVASTVKKHLKSLK